MTRLATDAAQTVNHATSTGTAEDTRSRTHGEAITTTTTESPTMTDEGGMMETIDVEEKMDTMLMMMADREGTKAMVKARDGGSTVIEATVTVCEMTAIVMSVATSAGTLRDAPRPLDVHVRILARARGLLHHPQHHPPKTKPSPISRHRAYSLPRRTRSSTGTELAPC